jgi:hypothetical protein
MDHENYQADTLAKYEFNHHPEKPELDEQMHYNIKKRKKPKKGQKEFDWKKGKKAVFDGANIQDASFSEITDESAKFRKAPSKDARELGLAKKSKFPHESSSHEEPAGIAAISEWKRNAKQLLAKKEPSKPSRKVRNRNIRNDPNWLIDEAFDKLVDTGKAVAKVGKVAGKTAGKAVKVGFHATKKGIQGFNEISDEIVKNPMLIRMGEVNEATLNGIASHRRHALNSIVATGANRKQVSAGSLVKQRGYVAHIYTSSVSPHTTTGINRVITKIVRRGNKDVVLYFLENGKQVTRKQAELIREGIMPVQANTASTTVEQSYSMDNKGSIVGKSAKSAKSASGLVTRHNNGFGSNQTTNNPVLNKPKTASSSGLVTRNHSGVDTYQSNGNIVDDSEHNLIGKITRKTKASGIVTRNQGGLANNHSSRNPVLNITQIASPSRLMRPTNSGVV